MQGLLCDIGVPLDVVNGPVCATSAHVALHQLGVRGGMIVSVRNREVGPIRLLLGMRHQRVLVKRPLLMRTAHLGASLLDQYVVEVDHYMTLRSINELLLVLHGHWRVIVTLDQLLLLLMMCPLLAHGLTEELLEPLRVGEDIRLLLILTLVHFLHAPRPRGTPFRGQLMRDWLHEILHHVTLARVSVLPAPTDIE